MSSNIKLQQESFLVTEQQIANRKKIIRQDRWFVDPKECFITHNNTSFEVTNLSPFGCGVLTDEKNARELSKFMESSVTNLFKLVYKNVETQTVALKPIRIHKISENKFEIGFETLGEPFKVERCKAISEAFGIIHNQEKVMEVSSKIPEKFRMAVYDLKNWFLNLKNQVDSLEKAAPVDDAKVNEEYRLTIADTISEYLGKFLPAVYQDIPKYLGNLSKEDNAICTEFIRKEIGQFVYGAPFANRAYNKPRGYAGDYEMMNHLYRNEMVGATLFDQCMHKYFIDEPAGNAVKNRGSYLHQKLKDLVKAKGPGKKIKILSIASGPAMEQQLFVRHNPEFYGYDIEFHCVDQDEESLKHAQRQMLTIERQVQSGFKFRYENLAIRNIIAKGLDEKDYDLIYSAGLFDYFTEPVAQATASQMLNGIKDDGQVIIGNFSKENPCVPFMEYVLDWILIYRSKEDLKNLFSAQSKTCVVEQEPLGVNIFAVLTKK